MSDKFWVEVGRWAFAVTVIAIGILSLVNIAIATYEHYLSVV